MIYLGVKALHVASVIVWIGGMIAAQIVLAHATNSGNRSPQLLNAALRWDRRITVPAMAATWGLGFWMALNAGWFPSGWLIAKLILVTVVSGLHGIVSGWLKRVPRDDEAPIRPRPRLTLVATLVAVLLIVVLVVVKP